jgi:hypothetical protein
MTGLGSAVSRPGPIGRARQLAHEFDKDGMTVDAAHRVQFRLR